jgi:ABC-type multidrug transport system ATPase subunit
VTHNFESLEHVDYIYILNDGKIVEEGTYEKLKESEIFRDIERKSRIRNNEITGEEDELELPDSLLEPLHMMNLD